MTNKTTSAIDLLPCPFGCEAERYRHIADEEIIGGVAIGCTKCGALGPFKDRDDFKTDEELWGATEAAWNTRASLGERTTSAIDLVERLRARKESVYDHATQGAEWQNDALCIEAADTITRLQAALEPFAKAAQHIGAEPDCTPCQAGLVPNRAFREAERAFRLSVGGE